LYPKKVKSPVVLTLFLSSSCFATEMGNVQVLGDMQYDGMIKIYETTLEAAVDVVAITDLDGDTDIEYELRIRAIDDTTIGDFKLTFNKDKMIQKIDIKYKNLKKKKL
jgi:hypothetical protein